ncbi:MAG: GreA/GreB family elongation factor [Verrucomicrobia bacterium]|nr:GreA/GreB family elongation factor [Verrucomicrobiota bacterium]
MTKSALRTAILQELHEELDRQAKAAALARDEAISEESQPENKWDTHSQEAAYLAEGQARLVIEIGESLAFYQSLPMPEFAKGDAIAVGAIVGVQTGNHTSWYFMGPRAGGLECEVDGRKILVITPQSPVGRQLVGRRVGDTILLPGGGSRSPTPITHVE